MGYSRDSTHYPPEMRDAVRKVFDTSEDVVFDCTQKARAASIRGQFYAYFRALREDAYRTGLDNASEIKELYRLSSQIVVIRDGTKVILRLKSRTAEMQSLRNALGGEEEAEESFAKLQEKL